MEKTNEQIAMRVSWNTIMGNVALSAFKLWAGLVGRSSAMLSDAVHSLSDVLSTIVVIIGVKLANQKADREHPYGHERFESVAAILLAVMLCITGLGIGYGGIQTVLAGNYGAIAIPGALALIAAVVSIVTKEGMYWYTRAAAKKINSSALMADAWHHRSDALSSIGSFLGILGARIGFPILDSVACIVICLFIVKAAIDIFRDAISKMTDRACSDELEARLRATILAQKDVAGIDLLQTRMFGDKIFVDVEISADGSVPLHISHDIAHTVHDAVETGFPNVKHCMVHVNPAD
ncbi:MAG: cation diffusion facilitator family transporter [Lawsonibacter sp.]|nr:cation diffusion facilitator family transporter [Lawsonibacter sp.]